MHCWTLLFLFLYSPIYGNTFDATTVLGQIAYDGSNQIDTAGAMKMTFYLKGGDAVIMSLELVSSYRIE